MIMFSAEVWSLLFDARRPQGAVADAGDGGNGEGLSTSYIDRPGGCTALSGGTYYFQGKPSCSLARQPLRSANLEGDRLSELYLAHLPLS